MKKEDLKAGYVIRFDDNSLAMITYGKTGDLCVSGKTHWFPVSQFNDDLTYCNDRIVKIYGYASNCDAYKLESFDRDCIWERKGKPTLTEAERTILTNVDKAYQWIARDKNGSLFIYDEEPNKEYSYWKCDGDNFELAVFEHLFEFIKWEDEEPYLISDLLK